MASVDRVRDGWRARWRTPEGASRSRNFKRKVDAERFLTTIEATKLAGGYVDPAAGRVTFFEFATDWLSCQTFDPSTREAVESRLRVHILPTLGTIELRQIRPSTVQAWMRGRQETCAPRYVRVMLANLSAILGAAVEDDLIPRNPCRSSAVRAPAVQPTKVVPWTIEQVAAVVEAHPERWRAAPVVAAGCGLRQGEVFGLRVEDVDLVAPPVPCSPASEASRWPSRNRRAEGSQDTRGPASGCRRHDHHRASQATTRCRRTPVHLPGTPACQPQPLQPKRLETGASTSRCHPLSRQRHARPPTLLCQRPTRSRDEHPGSGRLPRPFRSWLHAARLHAPHAVERGPRT